MSELYVSGQLMEGRRYQRVVYASPAVSSVYEKVYALDEMGAAAIAQGFPDTLWPRIRGHELAHMREDELILPAQFVVTRRENRGGGWRLLYHTLGDERTPQRQLAISLGPRDDLSYFDCTGAVQIAQTLGPTGDVYVAAITQALDKPKTFYPVPHPLRPSIEIGIAYSGE